ncbi:MAG: GLUG motif-containing protein, partial [bacterium]|nr:GLUG motif-containing protein [bacterium]
MKNIFGTRLTAIITMAAITASFAVMPMSATAADVPAPDNGAAGGISNGGEWSIYASDFGSTKATNVISDASDKGVVEVTGSANLSEQLQFDLSTMMSSSAAGSGKVVKSAKLRMTPMVTRAGIKHNLYVIGNEFTTTEGRIPVTQYDVPRGGNNDIFRDESVIALTADGLGAYPDALKAWQTDVDVTGNAVTAADNKLSFQIEYADGDDGKTEYATTNIAENARLNGGAVPLLYSNGATDYSKWIYPQLVLTYTDSAAYTSAYADFVNAYTALSTGKVTENSSIALTASNGSTINVEMYDDSVSPIKVEDQKLVYNNAYVGNSEAANVKLTVTKTEGEETASYSRVVAVKAEYAKTNTITFDASKNPKGEISVTSSGTTYKDGTAYAAPGGTFTVDGGANTGYSASVAVKNAGTDEVISANADGTYTMPDGNVEVSAEYSKGTFGTTRIAAINSISFKKDGKLQGGTDGTNLVMGSGRVVTLVKFDVSGYNADVISEASLDFTAWNTSNAKAVFYVPNNDWDEKTINKNFRLDGTAATGLSSFTTAEGDIISLITDVGRIIPGEDTSSAAEGVLKDYYLGSTGASAAASIRLDEALKTAMAKSSDNIITLMVCTAGGGNDAYSVISAPNVGSRPSLTITESASKVENVITEIGTAEDLELFNELVNGGNSYAGKTVKLLNDIDLSGVYNAESGKSWKPIGSQIYDGSRINSFAGTFDGGNHSIKGLYINNSSTNQGLFGIVSGTVKNLTVEGEVKASSAVGGIAGWSFGKIINCTADVNINAMREAGGIVGTLGNEARIEGCVNEGNIKIENKETYAGGIAAQNNRGIILNCTNSGKIENGMDGFRNKLGGIVGYLNSGRIECSNNSGEIVSNATVASYTTDVTDNYVGGIVGYSEGGTIIDSDNSGRIHNAINYAGGIAGFLQSWDTVILCNNSGEVSSGVNYAGGIVGYNKSSVSGCVNTGKVTCSGEFAGGVAGYLSTGTLSHCSYDEELNSGLKAVGRKDVGTITSDGEEPTLPPLTPTTKPEDPTAKP